MSHSLRLTKATPHGRTRHFVALESRIDIDKDTRILLLVQLRPNHAIRTLFAWMRRSGAGDLEVDAHGVILGAVYRLGAVESDYLMAEDEVAGDVRGDGKGGGVVVCCDQITLIKALSNGTRQGLTNHLIVGPSTRHRIVVNETLCFDLEEMKIVLVDCRAVAVITASEIVQDWAVMTGWPSSPLELDF